MSRRPRTRSTNLQHLIHSDYESDDDGGGRFKSTLSPQNLTKSYDIIATNCNCSSSDLQKWAKIRRLKSQSSAFTNISLYIQNSSCGMQVNIQHIFGIKRFNDRSPFNPKIFRMLLWHGTSPQAVPGIIQNGFRPGTGGLYGGGVYFADRFAKSAGYVRKTAGNTAYLLIAEVDLGRVYKAHNTHAEYKTPPPGFDSVKGNGSQIPTWRENRVYHGAILPCGASRANTRFTSYKLVYNEYIVYDPSKIIVRFLVQCTF